MPWWKKALIYAAYLLVWLIPLVVLFWMRDTLFPQEYVNTWTVPIGVIWSALVFIAWILIGDGSSAHEHNFAQHKSIWVCFILVVLVVILANSLSYARIVDRVAALRGTASLLEDTISNAENKQAGLKYWIEQGLERTRSLNGVWKDAATFEEIDEKDVARQQRYLHGYTLQSKELANLTLRLANELVEEEKARGLEAEGTSFEPVQSIAAKLVTTTQEIDQAFLSLMTATQAAQSGGEQEMRDLRIKGVELINAYYRAIVLVEGAEMAVGAGEVDHFAPFVMITVLYTVFLLFPWVLLFLFLFRKRNYLVGEKAQLISRLGLSRQFLERSPRAAARQAAGQVAMPRGQLAEEVGEQAFKNSEYVVSLMMLTLITATIWYFFFYPEAATGLAALIQAGGSVTAFTEYLIEDATPITFGFIGAYFFVLQLLLRRYFAGDLNPKAYIYAVVRLLTVFILGIAFHLGGVFLGWSSTVTSAIVFIVGIFPMSGLRWLSRWVNQLAQGLSAPEYIDRYPLTKLDGLNIWHEARLLEERIENIQNLATASLDDLIIRTNFSPMQLVDWVDQALLFIHAQERWRDAFQSVGVRTASDLLDSTRTVSDGPFDLDAANTLTLAINAAQAYPATQADHPREIAATAAAELHKSVIAAAAAAKQANETADGLAADKPETLDAIIGLQKELESLASTATAIKDQQVSAVAQALQGLPSNDGDLVKQAQAAVGEIEKSATALGTRVDATRQTSKQLVRTESDTLTDLPKLKAALDAICAAAANLKAQTASAQKIAQQGSAESSAPAEWTALLGSLDATREAVSQTLETAQVVRENNSPLDKNKPETLNKIVALQGRLSAMNNLVQDTKTKTSKAKEAIEGLPTSKFLKVEARTAMDALDEAIDRLVTLATNAKDTAAPLDIDEPATMAGLPEAKKLTKEAHGAAQEIESKGQTAVGALQAASAPPQITRETIQTMVVTLQQDPNIARIANFWQAQGN